MPLPSRNPVAGFVDVIVIGAGHAGLAMSWHLSALGIEHRVLERGEVANSWIHERWDSLRLLTPNWQSRLPGYVFGGGDRDGYMTMPEVIDFIKGYAAFSRAPVSLDTNVTSVAPSERGYLVRTSRGDWQCRAVVMASGAFNKPSVPGISSAVPANVQQLTPHDYSNPGQLADGGVLVVGASATGLQLADEIHRSGRPVTMAVGEHVRMPRLYRGRDIQHWMHVAGLLDQHYGEVDDIVRARRVPSPQLVGTPERRTLDLNSLTDCGVRLVGRAAGIRDGRMQFSGSLRNVCKLADLKMHRMLDGIDEWIEACGAGEAAAPPERFEPTAVDDEPRLTMDLESGEVQTILWATGFRPDFGWLEVPVLDHKARIRHDGGVTASPGLYVTGLPYLRRRKSSFIHGADDDARDLAAHIRRFLDESIRRSTIRVAV